MTTDSPKLRPEDVFHPRLLEEARRLGAEVVCGRYPKLPSVSDGIIAMNTNLRTGRIMSMTVWIAPGCGHPDWILAHELGHAIADLQEPLAWATFVAEQSSFCATFFGSSALDRMAVALETEAWEIGEGLLRRLGIEYDVVELARFREMNLNTYRQAADLPLRRLPQELRP